MIDVWSASVLATHHFLSTADFNRIKALVEDIDFTDFDVHCLVIGVEVAGFIGVLDDKVEMLFLSPDYFGQNLGKYLMHFAMNELKANKVDVNEQNVAAVRFYEKLGFETYGRSDKDGQGNDHPVLRMKLAAP